MFCRRTLLAALAALVFSFGPAVRAQETGAPNEKESTGDLAQTLAWLGEHIQTNFKYGYTVTETSSDTAIASHFDVIVNRAPLKFEDCHVSWRSGDDVVWLSLSDLDAAVVTVRLHAEQNARFESEVWDLPLVTKNHKKSVVIQTAGDASQFRDNMILPFDDKERAEALATAFKRAIRLCTQQNAAGVIPP